jgi:hypothetical protein
MNTAIGNIKQCVYKLNLLEQEFHFILSKHPADITVDEFDWMQIAFEQIPNCIKLLFKESTFETYLMLWYHQALKIEKYCTLRKLPIQEKFIEYKKELQVMNNNNMATKNN